ncbi:MAG TPA: AI-2E family transporter [Campylobacterales bacterium]|nr:AI-2E family transporter [Campylobacterales bacterium]HHH51229.1 AI-2E family transporter [Campylobacterales bacterium]
MMRRTDYVIAILFILALVGAYSIYQPFLLSIVVALLLTMATANMHNNLMMRVNSEYISATFLTLVLFIILFVPIIYIATIGVQYISIIDADIITKITTKIITLAKDIPILNDWVHEHLSDEKILDTIKTSTATITKAGTKSFAFVKDIFFVIVFYFVLNLNGEKFFKTMRNFLPMRDEDGNKILTEISSTMEIVFYSILVTAIFEGILFGVMVSFFGFNGLLLGIIYGFVSLIPVIGGAILWIPISLFAWSTKDANTALFIAIYSITIISIIADTFVKPMIIKYIKDNVLKSSVKINEILIFFSILAGMSSYGFWGMILGPAITSFLIAISKVYIDLYGHNAHN